MYQTIHTRFSEVKVMARKSEKCCVCGKRMTRQKKFYQTINPFNKNSDGVIKNRHMIYEEIMAEREEWLKTPLKHGDCIERNKYAE